MSTLLWVELTGSGNFTVPQGVYFLENVEGVGGSGGGGRGFGLGLGGAAAAGAAAARLNRFAVSPGQVFAYSQGAAGVGAPGTGSATAGGDTSFGSILLAKGSAAGVNQSNSVATPPNASACIGDVKVSGNAGTANSGGSGGTGGVGPTLTGGNLKIVAGAGGLSGADNNTLNGDSTGGVGGADGGGGGGGRNVTPLAGGNGRIGRLWVAYLLPEVWS